MASKLPLNRRVGQLLVELELDQCIAELFAQSSFPPIVGLPLSEPLFTAPMVDGLVVLLALVLDSELQFRNPHVEFKSLKFFPAIVVNDVTGSDKRLDNAKEYRFRRPPLANRGEAKRRASLVLCRPTVSDDYARPSPNNSMYGRYRCPKLSGTSLPHVWRGTSPTEMAEPRHVAEPDMLSHLIGREVLNSVSLEVTSTRTCGVCRSICR